MRLFVFSFSVLVFLTSSAMARQMEDMQVAVLRTIDKVSARTKTFEVPVEKTVKFGTSLFIKLRACRKAPPLDKPEDAAFLQIWERTPKQEESKWVFSGWMFSSNPALSAMEHPVYDVWVIECKAGEQNGAAPETKVEDIMTEDSAPAENMMQSVPIEEN